MGSQQKLNPLTLYYDEDCGFCKKGVYLLTRFLQLDPAIIKTAQSDPAIEAEMEAHNSWVVIPGNEAPLFAYPAFVALVSASPTMHGWVKVLTLPPVRWVGDRVYQWVSHNRSFVSKLVAWVKVDTP
ncbi:MAG: DUF393 domain-containing protein [Vampirovibrio sp.]|nr:DUF393 domain-containing protein [Vampirovibrio sp.]